jgi:hypothetical protein
MLKYFLSKEVSDRVSLISPNCFSLNLILAFLPINFDKISIICVSFTDLLFPRFIALPLNKRKFLLADIFTIIFACYAVYEFIMIQSISNKPADNNDLVKGLEKGAKLFGRVISLYISLFITLILFIISLFSGK